MKDDEKKEKSERSRAMKYQKIAGTLYKKNTILFSSCCLFFYIFYSHFITSRISRFLLIHDEPFELLHTECRASLLPAHWCLFLMEGTLRQSSFSPPTMPTTTRRKLWLDLHLVDFDFLSPPLLIQLHRHLLMQKSIEARVDEKK